MENLHLSKLDVAKREIEHAIRLFFSGGDFVVIHLVISACQSILMSIGGDSVSMKSQMRRIIKKERQKEFFSAIDKAYNFFKHADRDAKKLLEFNPFLSEVAIFDAVTMYQSITGEIPGLLLAYRAWFYLKNPDLLLDGELKKMLSGISPNIDTNNKKFFLEMAEVMESRRLGI